MRRRAELVLGGPRKGPRRRAIFESAANRLTEALTVWDRGYTLDFVDYGERGV